MLQEQLEILNKKLIESATLIEEMINKSIKGLMEKNEALLTEVIEADEPKANQFDNSIEEMCITLMAQFEPVAVDLRTILMVLKMNNDLERMGDHAVNISESGLFIIARPPIIPLDEIPRMAGYASKMLKQSIDAFINKDPELAGLTCQSDNDVDKLAKKVLKKNSAFMKGEQDGIKRALHHIRISHNLERIADLSTNIAEEVIFMVEGKAIKHSDSSALERPDSKEEYHI